VLLNGAGVEAASTVISVVGFGVVNKSLIPIGHIIRYWVDITLFECPLQILRVLQSE
jgi:hypothetical protein